MSAKVISLDGKRVAEVETGAVEILEEWLAKAKAGEVKAIAVVAVIEGSELLCSRWENDHWAALLAAHEMSRHDMLMDAYRG